MKWKLHPKSEDITTSLPLTLDILEWEGKPRVILDGTGELSLKAQKDGTLKSEFYVYIPGSYRVKLIDSAGTSELEFYAKEHRYLDFGEEFGFFFVLFLIVMGGIILWTAKLMKNN